MFPRRCEAGPSCRDGGGDGRGGGEKEGEREEDFPLQYLRRGTAIPPRRYSSTSEEVLEGKRGEGKGKYARNPEEGNRAYYI